MKSSFNYPLDVIASVLTTVVGRLMLFAVAIVAGLNIASLVRQGTLLGPSGIAGAIGGVFDLLFSVHFLAVGMVTTAAVTALVIFESRLVVGGWLAATCVAWCSIGLSIWRWS
jgi:hypothetical protein